MIGIKPLINVSNRDYNKGARIQWLLFSKQGLRHIFLTLFSLDVPHSHNYRPLRLE